MRILDVQLNANSTKSGVLRRFYANELGLASIGGHGAWQAFRVGATTLAFYPVDDCEPYYHFAIRVPRNRFEAALAWLSDRAGLLPQPGSGATTFVFDNWNALACYAHDPCGNIVELIAHRELPEETQLDDGERPFTAAELLAVCEVGLVGPGTQVMTKELEEIGLPLWDGSVDKPDSLAFMGSRDGVLILSPVGRGWLPTRQPAEVHPVDVILAGPRTVARTLPGTPHHVRTLRSSE